MVNALDSDESLKNTKPSTRPPPSAENLIQILSKAGETLNKYTIKMSEYFAESSPSIIRTNALGSCVGVVLFDPLTNIGGMAHIMLPSPPLSNNETGKYANTAIPALIHDLIKLGAKTQCLRAMLFGGADMFGHQVEHSLKIGVINISACKTVLKRQGIPVIYEDTGGTKGRTIELDCFRGCVHTFSPEKPPATIHFRHQH